MLIFVLFKDSMVLGVFSRVTLKTLMLFFLLSFELDLISTYSLKLHICVCDAISQINEGMTLIFLCSDSVHRKCVC